MYVALVHGVGPGQNEREEDRQRAREHQLPCSRLPSCWEMNSSIPPNPLLLDGLNPNCDPKQIFLSMSCFLKELWSEMRKQVMFCALPAY